MKFDRVNSAMLAAMLASLALVGCKKKEEPFVPPPVASDSMSMPAASSMSPAAMVNGVDLGNSVGADMRVTAPMNAFTGNDTIYAAVSTGTSEPAASVPGRLAAKWTHVDSNQVVHEESKDLTLAGDGITTFQISKPGGWPTGKYKVEIMLDGALVQTREFEVR